jgi:hypothetical protein
MTDEEPSKTCAKCKVLKSVAEFSKDRSTKDGLFRWCKACQKEYERSCKEKLLSSPIIEVSVKVCTVCKRLKDNSEFSKDTGSKSGLQCKCKQCAKDYAAAHKQEQAERNRAYYVAHKDDIYEEKREYYAKNKPRIDTYNKGWREENREWLSLRQRRYRDEHKDEVALGVALWKQRNPGRVSALNAKRKAAKRRAIPLWFEKEAISAIYEEAVMRSQTEGVDYHVDHIVPVQSKFVCGLHCLANLEVILGEENCSKGNRRWPGQEWIIHP